MSIRRILIFAGTTEGRELAAWMDQQKQDWLIFVSTATAYGKSCIDNVTGKGSKIISINGRMELEEIKKFIKKEKIELLIDATHPFAAKVTENLQNASSDCNVNYIRLLREANKKAEDVIVVGSVPEAAAFLAETEGNILIATGSKELAAYTVIPDYQKRCYARVLSTKDAVEDSSALGFEGAHLIAMQGPFSKAMNCAVIEHTKAKYFVTKESGISGGFDEKVAAAKETGAVLVVIGRPIEDGINPEQVKEYIRRMLCL